MIDKGQLIIDKRTIIRRHSCDRLGVVSKYLLHIVLNADLSGFKNLIGLKKIVKSLLITLFIDCCLVIHYRSSDRVAKFAQSVEINF